MRRRLPLVFCTFYCVDSKVKKERTEITVAEIAKLLPNRNECARTASLSLSPSPVRRSNCLFRKWTHTEINMLGKTFQIRSLVFFPCRRAHFSCISFACRTLFGCSFSFSSVPIQWNKLLRIVSCNPTIRLFVSLAALAIASCVLQYSSVSVYRLCIQYYSKCADAAGWLVRAPHVERISNFIFYSSSVKCAHKKATGGYFFAVLAFAMPVEFALKMQ